jgi:Ca-activated chloride channel family protein
MLAWLLLAAAAAGPRLPLVAPTPEGGPAQVHDIDIMVALDASASMRAADVSPRRLQRAKLELTDLLQRLHGERVGLIAFAGTAGLLAPPTDDVAAFRHYLALADPALFKAPGSNIAAALQLALTTWPEDAARTRALLLITDGEVDALRGAPGVAAEHAVAALEARGVTLYVLVVATPEGAPLPATAATTATVSRPDIAALRALGAERIEFVRDGDADWRALYDDGLFTLPGAPPAPDHVEAWRELYPYALAPALLLLVLARMPWRKQMLPALAGVAVVGLLAFSPPTFASEAEAYVAYRSGDYALAQLLYREQRGYAARLGEGAAAYRRQRYAEAVEQFSAALLNATTSAQRADALFNLGNGYFRLGNFAAAADAFAAGLELRADDVNARANLERALARLRTRSVSDRTIEGVLRRRGQVLGETPLGANDNGAPVEFDTTREPLGALQRRDLIAEGERATTPPGAAPSAEAMQLNAERDYRAALKKLELVEDRPTEVLKELIKLDAPRDARPELPPW